MYNVISLRKQCIDWEIVENKLNISAEHTLSDMRLDVRKTLAYFPVLLIVIMLMFVMDFQKQMELLQYCR